MIRRMEPNDVCQVITTHLASFPGFFLSFLGPRFLSLYYLNISRVPEGICYVYLNQNNEMVGFIVGALNPNGFYSRLLKRDWFRFTIASLGAVLKKPSIIKRLARAFLHPAGNPVGDDVAGLFSIGVLPEYQGKGVGKELVVAFFKDAEQRGCKKVYLTTDQEKNDKINAFYQSLGFNVERQYLTPEGRRMNEYWKNLVDKERNDV